MKISEMHKNRIPGPGVECFCVLARTGGTAAMLDLSARARGWRGGRRGEGAGQMGCWAGNECAVLSSLYNVLYILVHIFIMFCSQGWFFCVSQGEGRTKGEI